MSDMTLKIKNRSNEEIAARREYGIPKRRGITDYAGVENIIEYNTLRSDFCNSVYATPEIQRIRFIESIQNCRRDDKYVEFLQDYFYRKWKGYKLPYFELPLGNLKRMELYNQTALDSGHPEYMVDIVTGKPLKIHSEEIEDKHPIHNSETEKGVVDVLDENGNVVVENVGSVDEPKPKTEPKKAAKKTGAPVATPDVIYMEPKAPNKEAKKPAAKPEKSGLEEAVFFNEVGPRGNLWVDEERYKEYKINNDHYIELYPGLQKLVDTLHANGLITKFYDIHGLVRADVFLKGTPGCFELLNIDPAKIRNQYSIIMGGEYENGKLANPFDADFVSLDEPYLPNIVTKTHTADMLADSSAKSNVNRAFYKYINYNAVPTEDIAIVAANTYALCTRMQEIGLRIRFKITKYKDACDFDMMIIKNPGLGWYANNEPYLGLRLRVRAGNGVVVTQAVGDHADEYIKLIGDDIVWSESATDEQINKIIGKTAQEKPKKDSTSKKESKKKATRTIEKPMGRG